MLSAHGVPWDFAWSLPDETRMGLVIQCVEYEGTYRFDWAKRDFVEKPVKKK